MQAPKFTLPKWEEIPNIDLYLDQVISLIDDYLSPLLRSETDEPILTKTMVNNYVKAKIIAPPIKKKYSKETLCCIISVCILKYVYSMSDIAILIQSGLNLGDTETTYRRFCHSIETAISCAFENRTFSECGDDADFPYIMQNLAMSFATKFYALSYCTQKQNKSA